MKKILFLTINFPPNPSVGTRRVSKILKYIDHTKYQFSVLTLKPKYYDIEKGSRTGDDKKIPSSVSIYRTDRWDLTYVFTWFKSLLKKQIRKTNNVQPNNRETEPPSDSKSVHIESRLHKISTTVRDFIFAFFEFPDKYIGWLPSAVSQGIKIVRREKFDIIFTTAPPHSLFIIAMIIKKFSKAKLVLDFRDPWALSRWDKKASLSSFFEKKLEKITIANADLVLFVTENLCEEYTRHYGDSNPNKFQLYSNGFDPDDFQNIEPAVSQNDAAKVRMVHLGTLYKKRDPMPLFLAVKNLMDQGKITSDDLRIDFIGTIANELKAKMQKISELGIEKIVRFLPSVGFRESLGQMYAADILLIVQPGTDLQIPAKLFEYMYTGKPIFALAEKNSATDRVLSSGNLGLLAASGDIAEIQNKLIQMLDEKSRNFNPDQEYIRNFNIKQSIKTLENYLNDI